MTKKLKQKLPATFIPIIIILMLIVSISALALEPMLKWDFDAGRNLDAETGMAEFSRAKIPVFHGLKSQGTQTLQLIAAPKTDPTRLFADSSRGLAMRTGIDSKTGDVFAASGRLATPLSKEQGTVAFWLRPEDWDGNQQGKYHIFFAANDAASPRTNELLLYKNGDSNSLFFIIGDNTPNKWCIATHNIFDWKRGEWHFVCASWTPTELTLFVDGKATQRPRPRLSEHDYDIIHLGSRGWKVEGGMTLLDDVAVFPQALKREEMEYWYVQTKPVADDRAAPLAHRLGISSPNLDGRITPFEYGALLNSTFDIHSGELSSESRWAVGRDGQRLFLACDTPSPTRPPTILKHDGDLWLDESIEIHLEANGHHWQFIINANDAVYDAMDNSPAWNANGLKQAQQQRDGRWTIELSIPFADLGLSPKEGDRLYFTICRSAGPEGHTAASPLLRRFADRSNFIKVIFDNQAPPLELFYQTLPGNEGKLDLTARLPVGHDCTLRLLGLDPKGRKLYEQTADSHANTTHTEARLKAAGLSKEGRISYDVTFGGTSLALGAFGYLSPERIKVRYLMVHSKEQVLETMLALSPPLKAGLTIIQKLDDKNGKTVLRQETPLSKENAEKYQLALKWNLAALPSGEYDYYLAIAENGQEKNLHHQLFMKPDGKMPWDDFQAGIETEAPSPWHAPRHNGTALECLTQRYDFNSRLLPSQIHAQGEPLLQSPVALRINGKTPELPASFEIISQDPLKTHFQTAAEINGLKLEVNGILEYDGWLRLTLSMASSDQNKPATLDDLALVLPMTPAASRLVSSFKPSDTDLPLGKLDKIRHRDLMDHPVFWVGNADHGLFWGADSLRGTHLAKTDDILTITPTSGQHGARAVIKLVDCRLALTKPRSIAFGLQATPVKPLHRLSKPFMFRGGDTIATNMSYWNIFSYYNPAYTNRQEAIRLREAADRRGNAIFAFYSCIYGLSPFCPEWPWHCEQWISSPPAPGLFKQDFPTNDEKARNKGLWTFGCVANPQFLNWQLYWLVNFFQDKEVGARDLYFDMAYPRACDNVHHGCGWHDDFGHLRKTYPINANRTFTKRIRKILRDNNPASVLMYHPSGEPLPPIYGLVDFTIDGEVYVAEVAHDESYFDIFTPELLQSGFTGAKSGTNAAYISQLHRAAHMFNPARMEYWRRKVKAPEAVRAVRHFLGYCLLHDIHPFAGACIYNEGEILEKQLYSLGYDKGDFSFHPYWRNDCPVSCHENVLLSAYVFPNGKTLAVVLNDSKTEAVKATLSLNGDNGKQPPAAPQKIYDMETGTEVSFPIDVPPKGLRLIVFE